MQNFRKEEIEQWTDNNHEIQNVERIFQVSLLSNHKAHNDNFDATLNKEDEWNDMIEHKDRFFGVRVSESRLIDDHEYWVETNEMVNHVLKIGVFDETAESLAAPVSAAE